MTHAAAVRPARRAAALASAVLVASLSSPTPAQEPPATGADVRYGSVDAATVRVFAIGTVDVAHLEVGDTILNVARPDARFGTGFAAGPGIVLTAQHVIDGARHIVVRLPGDGGFYAARLLHGDKEADVAVLQADVAVPALDLAPDTALRVRQTVFAVGYPLDPRRTQAQSARGIVAGKREDGSIQLDMALNPGNSGGPLVDEQDRVVGMVIERGDPGKGVQGIGFAVPAGQLLADLREAERRLGAGQIPELLERQRHGAVVVDELVQRGVFHEIREAADLRGGLRTGEVQRALDALAGRIDDPDLLVFVGGHLWNVQVALEWADDETLWSAGLSRDAASRLAVQFGHAAAAACRKARRLDATVAERSAIVQVVLARWREERRRERPAVAPARAPSAPPPAAFRRAPDMPTIRMHGRLPIDLALRTAPVLRFNTVTGSVAPGADFGADILWSNPFVRIGPLRLSPMVGLGYGRAFLQASEGSVTHSFLAVEVGVNAELWRCRTRRIEAALAYSPGSYRIENEEEDTSEGVLAHGRFGIGYRWGALHLGAGVHVLDGPTLWVEPLVIAVVL